VCEFLVKRPETFTDFIRLRLKKFLDAVGVLLNKTGLHPNVITIIGLCGNITAAVFVALGKITIGGLIVLVAAPLDAFDGSMARARGEVSNWGAFVDSVSDRYSELLLLGGLSWYFISCNDHLSIPCLVINQPRIAIWILAIFSNFTALQRIYTVRRQVYSMSKSDKEKNLKRGQS
jgi:CDP-diacylglycerol--glycerol-3-phosphate 3-phosphatidyltransferase